MLGQFGACASGRWGHVNNGLSYQMRQSAPVPPNEVHNRHNNGWSDIPLCFHSKYRKNLVWPRDQSVPERTSGSLKHIDVHTDQAAHGNDISSLSCRVFAPQRLAAKQQSYFTDAITATVHYSCNSFRFLRFKVKQT